MRNLVTVLSLSLLAGCATMVDGTTQMVTVTTSPGGAACVIDQVGAPPGVHLEQIEYTPGALIVNRNNKPLKITCALEGYPTTQELQSSGMNATATLNVLNGVIVGSLIDSSSGALYRYPQEIHIDLRPHPVVVPVASTGRNGTAVRTPVTPTPLAPPPAPAKR